MLLACSPQGAMLPSSRPSKAEMQLQRIHQSESPVQQGHVHAHQEVLVIVILSCHTGATALLARSCCLSRARRCWTGACTDILHSSCWRCIAMHAELHAQHRDGPIGQHRHGAARQQSARPSPMSLMLFATDRDACFRSMMPPSCPVSCLRWLLSAVSLCRSMAARRTPRSPMVRACARTVTCIAGRLWEVSS